MTERGEFLSFVMTSVALWLAVLQLFFQMHSPGNKYDVNVNLLTRVVKTCQSAADRLFGQRFLSLRAVIVSVIITISYFFLFAEIAIRTSPPELETQIYSFYNLIAFGQISAASVVIFLGCALLTDFISVCETRFIMRKLSIKANLFWIISVLLLDCVLSYAIFIVIYPIPYSIFYVETLFEGNITTYQNWNLVLSIVYVLYVDFLTEGIDSTYSIISSGFHRYESGILIADIQRFTELLEKLAEGGKIENEELLQEIKEKAIYSYPFTTLLATTFVTSFWIWIYAASLLFVRLVFYNTKFVNFLSNRVNQDPRIILYVGLIINGLIYIGFF